MTPIYMLSQNNATKKADNLYNKFYYDKALSNYIKLEEKGISKYYVTRRIADCYRLLNMPVLATEWYEKAVEFPDVESETYYLLGLSLRILKRYEDADKYMARYYTLTKTTPRQRGLSQEDYLTFIKSDSTRVTVSRLGFNTQYSEFGPVIWNKNLIFTSNRPKDNIIKQKDARNNRSFFSIFSIPLNSLENNKKTNLFIPSFKSKYNEGPVCFSSDNNLAYITRNTTVDQSGKSELDIVTVRYRIGKWEKSYSSLPLKMKGYMIAHPSISADDERLYFVSDMPGGFGGMDIYYSERKGGFLSQPVNLGPNINTPGDELFPYISSDGSLYFASNGHTGLGGLDIYVALPQGVGFSEPYNLGPGINSSYDDFSIVFQEGGKSGYFASNRPQGKGEDDIYYFNMDPPLNFTLISGIVKNKSTGLPESDVQITITREDGMLVAVLQSGTDGTFNIHLVNDKYHKFLFRKRLMEPVERVFTPSVLSDYSNMDITVEMELR